MNLETTMDSDALDFSVDQFGAFLATRSKAQQARERLEREIKSAGAGTVVTVDFNGVEAMTISFADEFLGKLYTALSAGDHPTAGVRLAGLNEETREAIDICLERRDLIALALDDGPTLLGRTEPLQETFDAVLQLREFRAADLATRLSITAQNANNRLKRLVDAAALHRRQAAVSNRGGKEFVYTLVGLAG
ncbi:STAS-like domain-containing protein [Micromonospora sp. S4605]|uniref:STAS-like domain-containing protein n=1 Tax=Micromonospora sp. S4605 TaxID=1420897 RepID=UPI0013052BA7|nr:STAS-like domain-containing protein [Micromonospora sp. S4605]